MGIFKSNKSSSVPELPVEQVVAMKNQGYNNSQIIQSLQRDGYTSSQVYDAISQSEIMSSTPTMNNIGNTNMNPMMSAGPLPNMNNQMNQQNMQMNQNPQPMQQSNMNMPNMQQISSTSEEMIEAIIDEKWNDLIKDINKVIDWKQKADARLMNMEQQINNLQDQFDKLHNAILGKINDYDKHMLDVGAELQAMEKVFSKVLPTFVDNVNELTRITDKVKAQDSQVSTKKIDSKKVTGKNAPSKDDQED